MSALRGWNLPEQHLALDALVAFVDGELGPAAYDRAASHIAGCTSCSSEAAAQRQARSAIRGAEVPSMSSQFMQTLQSIPSTAELPGQPDGLAITEDGQLVTVGSDGTGSRASTTLGGTTPLGRATNRLPTSAQGARFLGTSPVRHPGGKAAGRRTKQGAGVVFSGLVLGALVFVNVPVDETRQMVTTVPRFPKGGTTGEPTLRTGQAGVPATSAPASTTSASVTTTSTTTTAGTPTEASPSPAPSATHPAPRTTVPVAPTRAVR